MPKSKRQRLVHTSKTQKKDRKELAAKTFNVVRENLDDFQYCYVFGVDNMRNSALADIRSDLEDSRVVFGKTKVISKALGSSSEDEYLPNLSKLVKYINGDVGLLFTSRTPEQIKTYFDDFSRADFARAGTTAERDFVVPAGTVYSLGGEVAVEDDVPMAHSLEPELRSLGMPTSLVRGKITLQNDYQVCKEGDTLDSRRTRLLKLFGVTMAEFRVQLLAYWSAASQDITEVADAMEE